MLRARGIPLALTPEGTTLGVAEHTVLLMLAALKLLPYADSELRQGRFHINALRPSSRELSGLTIGYVGMGRIAQAVAERLRAFGTRGLFYDPHVRGIRDWSRAPRRSACAADIVSPAPAALPRDAAPYRRAPLARMKPGAYLVNTARGGLVDEAALADALDSGHLAGAALDVFEAEPVAAGHPLSDCATWCSRRTSRPDARRAEDQDERALRQFERFYRGEPLANRIF